MAAALTAAFVTALVGSLKVMATDGELFWSYLAGTGLSSFYSADTARLLAGVTFVASFVAFMVVFASEPRALTTIRQFWMAVKIEVVLAGIVVLTLAATLIAGFVF